MEIHIVLNPKLTFHHSLKDKLEDLLKGNHFKISSSKTQKLEVEPNITPIKARNANWVDLIVQKQLIYSFGGSVQL